MLSGYVPVLVMIVVAAVIAVGMVAASALLGPKKPSAYKQSPYECGVTPVGTARERFPVKFYLVAMLFIVFDIETIFLYPWAVTYRGLPHAVKVFELTEVGVFVAILLVGYVYILGKGALDWDESAQARRPEPLPAGALAARPKIRFGNEGTETVASDAVSEVHSHVYGASAEELAPIET